MSLFYKVFAVSMLIGYGAVGLNGYELGGGDKREIPQNVRQSATGWRSHHFWYVGYHGGK